MQFIKKSLIAAVLAGALAAPAWSASLDFVPTSASFAEGSSVSVDVVISGLAAGEQLGAFDLVVSFDPAFVGLSAYQLGNQLGDSALFESIDASAGSLAAGRFNLAQISFLWDLTTQPAAFTLATLTFNGLAAGQTALSFSDVTLGDALGAPLAADLGSTLLNVTAVPEPGTSAMLLAGLGLLGLMARRRKSA